MINYIETNSTMKRYEPGRQRAAYLKHHRKHFAAEPTKLPYRITSWEVDPEDVVSIDPTKGAVVRAGNVRFAGTKASTGKGEFYLSFRRRLANETWTNWQQTRR